MDIPQPIKELAVRQNLVLFLGAGASRDSRKSGTGELAVTSRELADLLCDKYLTADFKGRPLHEIAEYAISETDLVDIQTYIGALFSDLEPTEAHLLIPKFRWAGLATTNYDLLVETAYQRSLKPCQRPVPFIANGDTVDDKLQSNDSTMFLKLHGCITRTQDRNCPLILSTNQYITHREGRSRIFAHFKEWSYEKTFVFVGHSLQDSDIRQIILEMRREGVNRRHYIVDPFLNEVQRRYWASQSITCLSGTMHDFLTSLDACVDSPFRNITVVQNSPVKPVLELFGVAKQDLSHATTSFLEREIDYLHRMEIDQALNPSQFYSGSSLGWSAIEQELDVRRTLEETVLYDYFLEGVANRAQGPTLLVIKGHAGSGKSIFLKRLCWEAVHTLGLNCFYLRDEGTLSPDILTEILDALPERLYLFVDQASRRSREIRVLLERLGRAGSKLTLITSERFNEWNSSCLELSDHITGEYKLGYLSTREISNLLDLLTKHKSLGVLATKSREEQEDAFTHRAGRQLLVALHEATLGKKFEEIIEDEYRRITPLEAQNIYLTICVLNRLGVPVRAGVVSRVHGVSFEDFSREFFAPLEMVVHSRKNTVLNDYEYLSRHPEIAQIVFERILVTQEHRFELYSKCLSGLNIDYSTDRQAARRMLRGRVVGDLFPSHEIALQVWELAHRIIGPDSYLLHQSALYELHRPNGNLQKAREQLDRAHELDPKDLSIRHSRAEYYLKCATAASNPLEEEKYLENALETARALKRGYSDVSSHPIHTIMKILLIKLEHCINEDNIESKKDTFSEIVSSAEETLSRGLQQFPGDQYLLDAEHRLAVLLKDSSRAIDALKGAFEANNRNGFIAVRLAKLFKSAGQDRSAEDVLKIALTANRGNTQINFELATLLLSTPESDGKEIEYYLQRSYIPGDGNYTAMLLHARQLYAIGSIDDASKVFAILEGAHVSFERRVEPKHPLPGRFAGTVSHVGGTFGFIKRDGTADGIFFLLRDTKFDGQFPIRPGTRLSFDIAFNFKGPVAIKISR